MMIVINLDPGLKPGKMGIIYLKFGAVVGK
jgi:hypothetical protein